MSDLRSEVCVILQRVKCVKLGESLEPVADDVLRLIAARMTNETAIEAAAKGAWNHNTTEWTWERAKADGSGFLAERMRTNIEAARPAIDAALKAAGVVEDAA